MKGLCAGRSFFFFFCRRGGEKVLQSSSTPQEKASWPLANAEKSGGCGGETGLRVEKRVASWGALPEAEKTRRGATGTKCRRRGRTVIHDC